MPNPVSKLIPVSRLQTREKIKAPLVVPSVAPSAKRNNAKGVITPAKAAINHMGRVATLLAADNTTLVPDLLTLGSASPQDDTIATCNP